MLHRISNFLLLAILFVVGTFDFAISDVNSGSTPSQQPPIIDISALLSEKATLQELKDVSLKIDDALKTFGIFVAVGHHISESYYKDSISKAQELFDLPQSLKSSVSTRNVGGIGRGYLEFGSEAGLSTFYEIKEGYSYGHPYPVKQPYPHPLQAKNVWPSDLPRSASKTFERVHVKKLRIATRIVYAMDLVLKDESPEQLTQGPGKYAEMTRNGESISLTRLFHYFAQDEKYSVGKNSTANQLGSSPHTDWGFLTLILHDGTQGLQYFDDTGYSTIGNHDENDIGGVWRDVPWIENGIIVNGGDYLRLLSEGRYKSPIHRVLSPPAGQHRLSFVLFHYPGTSPLHAVPCRRIFWSHFALSVYSCHM